MNKHTDHGHRHKKHDKHPPSVVALYESLLQLVMPMVTKLEDRPHQETPITASCNIVDISGVSLMQFFSLRGHLGDASALATARYPETLDSILVRDLLDRLMPDGMVAEPLCALRSLALLPT